MTTKSRLLAYAQLLRLPNVFTAFADICMAGAATGAITGNTGSWVMVLLASGCLYLAGMVWNDFFDRHEDAKVRGFRPIPSGRVSARTAAVLGTALLVAGIGFALVGGSQPIKGNLFANSAGLAGVLAAAILLYNRWLKHTPVGPIGMGACRFLNVLLGASAAGELAIGPYLPPVNAHLAAVVGVYIVGVTWFARTEEGTSNRRHLLAASGVMAVALGLALAVPLHLPEGTSPWYFPILVVAFGFYIGMPIAAAVQRPDPKRVQAAVKRCILGLVVLDAVLATAFVGWPGLLILLLLPPALLLGKWVYST
jgi:4-hydroxybenzoate polyprenyltransferase